MANISAADVKKLREKTGAGMMDCKKALVESDGNFDEAEKLLKEKGLAAVEKRAGRATNEGKIFVKISGNKAVLVELASETDFVARNPEFIDCGNKIAETALAQGIAEPTPELAGMVTDLATKIRENMSLKRLKALKCGADEMITSYIHADGNIGVALILKADKPEALQNDDVKALAYDLAMHVAAFNPLAVSRDRVDPAHIKEQEEIFRAQMEQDEAMKSKPEKVRENILKGKVNKYLADVCMMDQEFVKDDKLKVSQILVEKGKALGAKLSVSDFVYFKVGE
jgi:elongation factor Ts